MLMREMSAAGLTVRKWGLSEFDAAMKGRAVSIEQRFKIKAMLMREGLMATG